MAITPESAEDQAYRLASRLKGTPPSAALLQLMRDDLLEGKVSRAALRAIDDASTDFYRLTVKNLFASATNMDGVTDVELSDFLATIVGLIRENERFDQILYGDVLYTATDELQLSSLQPGYNLNGDPLIRANDQGNPDNGKVFPIFTQRNNQGQGQYSSNAHYTSLQIFRDWPSKLVKRSQSTIYSKLATDGNIPS